MSETTIFLSVFIATASFVLLLYKGVLIKKGLCVTLPATRSFFARRIRLLKLVT